MARPVREPKDPNFLTQAQFARRHKVARSTPTGWKHSGLLVFNDAGLIDVAKSEARLRARPAVYRGGATGGRDVGAESEGDQREIDAAPDITPNEVAAGVPLDETKWTLADAARVREIYGARQRRLEFEVEEGRFVPIAPARKEFERFVLVIRDRFLTLPGKVADRLVDQTRGSIEATLRSEVHEILNELAAPEAYATTK